jgi:transposase
MIRLPASVFVATNPIDLRLSFDRLAGIVREQLGGEPRGGEAMYIFHNRARTHVKILWHDGRGYSVLYRRLDRGTYRIPLAIPAGASRVSVSMRELEVILDGIDNAVLREARRAARASSGKAQPRSSSARRPSTTSLGEGPATMSVS